MAGQAKIEVFDTKTGKTVAEHAIKGEPPQSLRFSHDGARLAMWHNPDISRASAVLIWDVSAAKAVPRPLAAEEWTSATCVAFSPNGAMLAVGYADGTTLLWDLTAK